MFQLAKKKHIRDDYFCSWNEHIEFVLNNLGMNYIWNLEGKGFSNELIKLETTLRMNDIYHQEWHDNMINHEFCDFYKLVKNDWGKMKYLTDLCFYDRRLLCKWRCRSNFLPISSSRFTISDDILCPLCKGEHIGDEIHYLTKCTFFANERSKYLLQISTHYVLEPILDIFRKENPNPDHLRNIISFIKIVMFIFDNKSKWDKEMVFEPLIFDEDEGI